MKNGIKVVDMSKPMTGYISEVDIQFPAVLSPTHKVDVEWHNGEKTVESMGDFISKGDYLEFAGN